MNNNKKILKLLVRFLFYGQFAVWSFAAGFIIRTGNSGNFLQDNEAYLITSEYSSFYFNGEEDSYQRAHYPGSYLNSSGVNLFNLHSNYYIIRPDRPLIPVGKYIICDFTRPPPVLSSLPFNT